MERAEPSIISIRILDVVGALKPVLHLGFRDLAAHWALVTVPALVMPGDLEPLDAWPPS